jgi:hypothetical protein
MIAATFSVVFRVLALVLHRNVGVGVVGGGTVAVSTVSRHAI